MELGTGNKAEIGANGALVVINGPVASGKNTLAEGLASMARERGLPAAAIDMATLVSITNWPDRLLAIPEHWRLARLLAARMADALLEDGMHLVASAGPFFTAESREDLLRQLRVARKPPFVMLHVSLEESYARIKDDPSRVVTKNRDFVRQLYESIDWASQPADDIVVETDALTRDQVLEKVALQLRLAVR